MFKIFYWRDYREKLVRKVVVCVCGEKEVIREL